ncbi:GyrI-like domain-containing protein [Aminipila sp.]|uniref:GyrI-like domain-containing protein n=1 Tax=Aminipila sp. TaxID=2060095 RepID=UPI0028989AE8|nr:GyrI-like domain-containing protein [Aminipila sp.]
MKHEWKKHEKQLYSPKTETQLLTVPKQKYFAIKGVGNPNSEDFAERIAVLYSLGYAVRMMPKSGFTPEGYFEYTVYPLEGVWEACDMSNKDSYVYTIMIRQPDFVTSKIAEMALQIAKKKKPHSLLDETYFCEIEDGLSVQILHEGDYDDEPFSFEKMLEFMKENGFTRKLDTHREIYLSDARKVERDKLKTILRYTITK